MMSIADVLFVCRNVVSVDASGCYCFLVCSLCSLSAALPEKTLPLQLPLPPGPPLLTVNSRFSALAGEGVETTYMGTRGRGVNVVMTKLLILLIFCGVLLLPGLYQIFSAAHTYSTSLQDLILICRTAGTKLRHCSSVLLPQ